MSFGTLFQKNNCQKRFIRDRSLGEDYLKDSIIYRIDREFLDLDSPLAKLPISNRRLEAIIDLDSDPKFKTSPGLRHWAIKQNNNRFMETMNQMIKLGIGSYNQLINYDSNLENNLDELNQVHEDKKKELEVVKNDIQALDIIIAFSESKIHSETYLTLTNEIKQKFDEFGVDYKITDMNKIQINKHLVSQFKEIKNEQLVNFNHVKSDLANLSDKAKHTKILKNEIHIILDNYISYLEIDNQNKII